MDDFPKPETPVKMVICRLGTRSEMSFRLFSRAPRMSMNSFMRTTILPAHQLGDLNEVAAGVVEHGDLRGGHVRQLSLILASFSIEIRTARASSGVLTGPAKARRIGRGPSLVFADISNPYRSMPVMVAEVISVAFEKALQ